MKSFKMWVALSILSMGLISCDPDPLTSDDANPPSTTYSSVQELLDDLAPPVQQFTFDASTGTTITTPRGSEIVIPAQALVTASGQTVSGNVTLNFQEIFNPSDMITTGVYTESNGIPLTSGGAYYIGIEQNGTPLEVSSSSTIQVSIPQQATDSSMQLFVADNLGAGTGNSWQLPDSAMIMNFLIQSGLYQVTQQTLNWVNCDAFYNVGFEEPIHFDLLGNSNFDDSNTLAISYVQSNNSIFSVIETQTSTFLNSEMRNYRLPNLSQTIIMLGLINGQFYLGTTQITPVAGTTYPVQMTVVTQADVTAFLATL